MESELESALRDLGGDERIRAVWLFGSVARGEAGASSDIDVAIWAGGDLTLEERFALRAQLVRTLERDDIDLVPVEDATPVLGYRVVTDGRRLYADDPEEADRYEQRLVERYLDTAHLRRKVQRLQRREVE